jgi:4-amino-4-deoxy-L-arabinose transferase-like glycosyltransferase
MKKLALSFYSVILFLICLFHLSVNTIFIFLNTAPLPWDQAGHTKLAIEFAHFLTSRDVLKIVNFFSISTYYPPLTYTFAGIPITIFGNPILTSEIVVTLFFLVSIFLVYKYISELFYNKQIGILSSVIFSFFPIVFEHSRWLLLEIPLLTFLFATLLFLLRSRNFTEKKNTLLFFIFFGLSLITKWTAAIYILLPALISFYYFLKSPREIKKQALETIINGFILFLTISLPWYLINLSSLIKTIPLNLTGESSDPKGLLSLWNWGFYPYVFVNFQATLVLSVLFILGACFILWKKGPRFPLLYIVFIYLFFSFLQNKDARYVMPLLPFVASVIAFLLINIMKRAKIIGFTLITIILIYQASYLLILSFRNVFPNFTYQRAINFPIFGWLDYINLNDNLAHSYNQDKWPQEDIINTINKDSTGKINVLCMVDKERFNYGNFLLQRDLMKIDRIEIENPPFTLFTNQSAIDNYLRKYRYVILLNGELGNVATRNISVFNQLKSALEKKKSVIVWQSLLPNNDIVTVLKLNNEKSF